MFHGDVLQFPAAFPCGVTSHYLDLLKGFPKNKTSSLYIDSPVMVDFLLGK